MAVLGRRRAGLLFSQVLLCCPLVVIAKVVIKTGAACFPSRVVKTLNLCVFASLKGIFKSYQIFFSSE